MNVVREASYYIRESVCVKLLIGVLSKGLIIVDVSVKIVANAMQYGMNNKIKRGV
jgi:hypothetical protein